MNTLELQIRLAGWAADGPEQSFLAVDGVLGPKTKRAVERFQAAYGLTVDGIVGHQTTAALHQLDGLSPYNATRHFDWWEFWSKDGALFSGGRVKEQQVIHNVGRLVWKLEALRRKAGHHPVIIHSGFRSAVRNAQVGGVRSSLHMYGIAADISVAGLPVDEVAHISRTCGFSAIIVYEHHVHVDSRREYPDYGSPSWYWP